MTRITLSGTCGNSPKNAFAETVAAALMSADTSVRNALADDCVLKIPGSEDVSGRDTIVSALPEIIPEPDAVTITSAITHGRIGAIEGWFERQGDRTPFALGIGFKNTKADAVSAIRLYFG